MGKGGGTGLGLKRRDLGEGGREAMERGERRRGGWEGKAGREGGRKRSKGGR